MNLKRLLARDNHAGDAAMVFSGRWKNELNSEMELIVDDKGRVTGSYTTEETGGSRAPYPLSGYVNGDLITFTVNFEPASLLCAWAGQGIKDGSTESISTHWNMVKHFSPEQAGDAPGFVTLCGSNIFKRVG